MLAFWIKHDACVLDQTRCLRSGSNTLPMDLIEEILSSDDDDLLLCEEADSETLTVSEEKTVKKKRKRYDLEEGEIEEESVCSNGFFFDMSLMKKVPGCIECNNKRFCKRV